MAVTVIVPGGAGGVGAVTVPGGDDGANALKAAIVYVIDGGGSVIATGLKEPPLTIPFNCTITGVDVKADQSGSIVIDVLKTNYLDYDGGATHPASGDSIAGSSKPTIASSTKYRDTTLTGWDTEITKDDVIAFNVDSASTITRATITLNVSKSS